VRINDPSGTSRALAESEGSTKKQAQQEAARLAFEQLLAAQKSEQKPAQPASKSKRTTEAVGER
jgi:ribonuclease-3